MQQNHQTLPIITCVSLGPGDAGLVTLNAFRVLQDSDIVYCPETKVASRSLQILRELSIQDEKIRLFHVTMSKDRSRAMAEYASAAEDMIKEAKAGKRVAVVAEGDSGFYSSARYITDMLQEDPGIELRIIPGIPAFIACGARAGLHVVKQEESLRVVTADLTLQIIADALREHSSLVIMKLSQHKDVMREALSQFPEAEFHYFENVGVPEKDYYTSDRTLILKREIPYFSILIIKHRA